MWRVFVANDQQCGHPLWPKVQIVCNEIYPTGALKPFVS